jgi:hypothetical protein
MTTTEKKPAITPEKANRNPPRTAWKKGESGNPAGKAKGTRNRATMLAMAILEKDLEAIAKKVTEAAIGGDLQAARMVLERLVPATKERPVQVTLPDTSKPEGITKAQAAILTAVAGGELTPSEGTALAGMVEQHRKALETQELERRISALEEKK